MSSFRNAKAVTGVIGIVAALGAVVCTGAAAPPVEVSLQAIAVTKTKTFAPTADEVALPTPGLDLVIALRVTDGRKFCSLGDLEIARAVDDTGSTISISDTTVRTHVGTTEAQTRTRILRTINQSVSSHATAGPTLRRRELIPALKQPPRVASDYPGKPGGTTAVITAHLGAPSPLAKALRRIEGKVSLQVGDVRSLTFKNIESRVHDPLDLGSPRNVTLEITSAQNGKVTLVGSGDPSRLGELEFYDRKGEPLSSRSTSRSQSTTDGVGQVQMQYDLGYVEGPIDLKVTVFGSTEQVETPFVFENVELP